MVGTTITHPISKSMT
ncbi:hypothetical protein SOVF_134290, partial [Spinacia oleracea]